MLTRYKGQLKLKDWAFAIASRSTMRKTRVALRAASPASCTRCCGTKPSSHRLRLSNPSRQETASSSRKERRPREGADDGADCVARGHHRPAAFSTLPPCTQLTPSSAGERAEKTGIPRRRKQRRAPPCWPQNERRSSQKGGEQTYKGCRGRPGVPPEAGVPKRGGVQSCAWLALRNRDGGLERTIRLCYFFTSGQVDCDSGWNASSVGIVARSR